mgnify:CR=1 FL=1
MKQLIASESLLTDHYESLKDKPFFPKLMKYMNSGPVIAMIWKGDGVVLTARKMLGATNPKDSEPGTIRGDFSIEVGRNVIHGSDSVESAEREIGLWFQPYLGSKEQATNGQPAEIVDWSSCQKEWIEE